MGEVLLLSYRPSSENLIGRFSGFNFCLYRCLKHSKIEWLTRRSFQRKSLYKVSIHQYITVIFSVLFHLKYNLNLSLICLGFFQPGDVTKPFPSLDRVFAKTSSGQTVFLGKWACYMYIYRIFPRARENYFRF